MTIEQVYEKFCAETGLKPSMNEYKNILRVESDDFAEPVEIVTNRFIRWFKQIDYTEKTVSSIATQYRVAYVWLYATIKGV